MKNENSAATKRDAPKISAPKIVDPERDVPGTIDSTWNNPMNKAILYDMAFKSVKIAFLFAK